MSSSSESGSDSETDSSSDIIPLGKPELSKPQPNPDDSDSSDDETDDASSREAPTTSHKIRDKPHDSSPSKLHIPRSFFDEHERQILKLHTATFRHGTRREQQQLVTKIIAQLQKEGSHHSKTLLRRKVLKYLGSQGRRTLERLVPWKKPSLKTVVLHEHDEEIKQIVFDEYGLVPGDSAFLGKYAIATKNFIDQLPEEKEEELRMKQAEWRAIGPPKDRQRKVAENSLDNLLLRFSQKLYWESGARIVVLAGFRATNATLRYGVYDFNALLGSGKSDFSNHFPAYTKSEMVQRFQDYLQESLTDDEGDPSSPPQAASWGGQTRRSRPLPELAKNKWKEPLLPKGFLDIKDLQERMTTIRAWIAGFYCLAAGKSDIKVPWSVIKSNPSNYIEMECWPADVEFKEPSKLRKDEIQTLYDFWSAREQNPKKPAFQFHHVQGPDARDSRIAAADWRSSAAASIKRPRRRKKKAPKKEAARSKQAEVVPSKIKRASPLSPQEGSTSITKAQVSSCRSPSPWSAAIDTHLQTPTPAKQDNLPPPLSPLVNGNHKLERLSPSPPRRLLELPITANSHLQTPAAGFEFNPQPHTVPQPFSASYPPQGQAPFDAGAAMNAVTWLSRLIGINPAIPSLPINDPRFVAPNVGFHPAIPVIDPTLENSAATHPGYPTTGPNDTTPPGYYPIPHGLMVTPPNLVSETSVFASTSSNPYPRKLPKTVKSEEIEVSLTKLSAQEVNIKPEFQSPTKLALRRSPAKRKFSDYDGHSELSSLDTDKAKSRSGTKKGRPAPRPLTKPTGTAARIKEDPDALFVMNTFRR